jgi:hypothetical protein
MTRDVKNTRNSDKTPLLDTAEKCVGEIPQRDECFLGLCDNSVSFLDQVE